jgi:hypothetical protein
MSHSRHSTQNGFCAYSSEDDGIFAAKCHTVGMQRFELPSCVLILPPSVTRRWLGSRLSIGALHIHGRFRNEAFVQGLQLEAVE